MTNKNLTLNRTCPFCGMQDAHLVQNGKQLTQVHCWDCGATGPRKKSKEKAITVWNSLADELSQKPKFLTSGAKGE